MPHSKLTVRQYKMSVKYLTTSDLTARLNALENVRFIISQEGGNSYAVRMGYKYEREIDYLKAAIRARRGKDRQAILEEMRQEIEAI
jgi:hypothetical protein